MVTKSLEHEQTYKLRIVKDIYVDLKNLKEAEQIADMIALRESSYTTFGKMSTVYTEIEEID
jgi:uncharacterized protein YacL (UPF0231 family)